MAKPDILLRDDRISVIGKGTSVQNEIERGVMEVSVGEKKTPSIRMSADQANVNIGGGDGASTEGDLRLNTEDGNTRIQMTAADDGNRTSPTNVWINGRDGVLEMGPATTVKDRGSVSLDSTTANLTLGGGLDSTEDGEIILQGSGGNNLVQITGTQGDKKQPETNRVYINGANGVVQLGAETTKWERQDVKIDPRKAHLKLGGGKREVVEEVAGRETEGKSHGSIQLQNESGMTGVDIRGGEGKIAAGGQNIEGELILRHAWGNREGSVDCRIEADKNKGLEFSISSPSTGSNWISPLRIDMQGNVHIGSSGKVFINGKEQPEP